MLEPDSEKFRLGPDLSGGVYSAFPNDYASNDSIAKYLNNGVLLHTQPGGEYSLTIRTANAEGTPTLRLYFVDYEGNSSSFRIGNHFADVSPTVDESIRFDFDADYDTQRDLIAFLVQDEEYFSGEVEGFIFEGEGSYSSTFGINLILVGEHTRFRSNQGQAALQLAMQEAFSASYGRNGAVQVDEVQLVWADELIDTIAVQNDHGDLLNYSVSAGKEFSYSYYAPRLDTLSMVVPDAAKKNLDLVIIESFEEDGILGASPVYGLNLGTGRNSTVMLAANHSIGADVIEATLFQIANTAVHESGHFFGLRHTTATSADMTAENDFSIVHDGLDDTDFCADMEQTSSIFSKLALRVGSEFYRILAKTSSDCPDATNLMFPTSTMDELPEYLSDSQIDIVRRNLSLLPR